MKTSSFEPKETIKNGRPAWVVYIPQRLGGGRRFFPTKGDAQVLADKLGRSQSSITSQLLALPPDSQAKLVTALQVAGGTDALLEGAQLMKLRRDSHNTPIGQVVTACLLDKKAGGLRHRSLQSLESTLTQFKLYVGGVKPMSEITSDDIRLWLSSGGWSAATRRGYLTDVRTLFSWAKKNQKVFENVALQVEKPRLDGSAPKVLTVEEVTKLLTKLVELDVGLVGYVAPILFGGLRPTEAAHASAPVDGFLSVGSEKAKGRQRRLIEIKGTLKSWLSLTGVEYAPKNLAKRMKAVRAKAGIPWPHDCLRHSFCSYAYPVLGAAKTAEMACHTEQVLFTNYRALVTEADARRFWEITPASLSEDQGKARKSSSRARKSGSSAPQPKGRRRHSASSKG